jgi:hypothetical protein
VIFTLRVRTNYLNNYQLRPFENRSFNHNGPGFTQRKSEAMVGEEQNAIRNVVWSRIQPFYIKTMTVNGRHLMSRHRVIGFHRARRTGSALRSGSLGYGDDGRVRGMASMWDGIHHNSPTKEWLAGFLRETGRNGNHTNVWCVVQ